MLKVRQLSGGERARLSLALITRDAPHVLILDEPTNHLDVDAREALVQALTDFGGAVVVVSHDRHLLGLIADRLVLVDGGTATDFDGTLDEYRNMVLGAARGNGTDGQKSGGRAGRKDERRMTAHAREQYKALRKAVLLAEAELKRLWQRRTEIDQMLAVPQSTKGTSVSDLMKTRAEIERQIAKAEQGWLEAGEAAERASAAMGARGEQSSAVANS